MTPEDTYPTEALRAKIEAMQVQLNKDMAAEGLTPADLGFVDDVKPNLTPEKIVELLSDEVIRITAERDKYAAALREIVQDPVPNLTHVKIAKAALGW